VRRVRFLREARRSRRFLEAQRMFSMSVLEDSNEKLSERPNRFDQTLMAFMKYNAGIRSNVSRGVKSRMA